MIIGRVKIERFRGLREFERDFGPGLIVVHGPNESGKTTLQEAIAAAFYAKPGAANKENERMLSWAATSPPRLELALELDDGPALLEKDFAGKKTKVVHQGRTITAAREVQAWIADRIGCPTPSLFEATACVREEAVEIQRLDNNKPVTREILARLQALLTGAPGGSPGEVMRRLKSRAEAIDKKPGARGEGGPLFLHLRRLEEARRRLQKLRQDLSAWDLAAAELEKLTASLAELERRQSALKAALGNHRLHYEAVRGQAVTAEKLERMLKAEKLTAERDQVRAALAGREEVAALAQPIERLTAIAAERRLREERLTELGREQYRRAAPAPRLATALAVLAAAAALIGGGLGLLYRSALGLWLGLAAGLPLAAAAILLRRRERARERKGRAALDAAMAEEESALSRLAAEVNEIVPRFHQASEDDCVAEYRRVRELRGQESALGERIRDLAGPEGEAEIGRRVTELALELRSEKEREKELAPYRISDPSRLAALEQEEVRLIDERERLLARKHQAEGRLAAANVDTGELAELEEEEAEEKGRCDYWGRQLRVHEKAIAVLAEATESVMAKAGEVIEAEIAPFIAAITSGCYHRVKADPELNLSLFSPGRGDWVGEEDLSLATREQLYFAARLALVRLVTDNKRPPVMLDDPFAHYDPERLRAVMLVLKEFSRTHQVILFTPGDRYHLYADRVVELQPI